MFSKHLLKVIIGFCAVILVGLISLVVINSLGKDTSQTAEQPPCHNTASKPVC